MYNKMLMLLLLFSLFFPGISFVNVERSDSFITTADGGRISSKTNRFVIIITVVILYICSNAVKLFYDQLDWNTTDNEYIHSADRGRTFPTSWPISWQPYRNSVANILENDRPHSRNQRQHTRRHRMHSRPNRLNETTDTSNNLVQNV